jgi:hypothetical protein
MREDRYTMLCLGYLGDRFSFPFRSRNDRAAKNPRHDLGQEEDGGKQAHLGFRCGGPSSPIGVVDGMKYD